MMHCVNLRQLYREVWKAPYYWSHPERIPQLILAKWQLKRNRVTNAVSFLQRLGFEIEPALTGLDKWRPSLEDSVKRVNADKGHHGSVSFEDGVVLYGITRALRPQFVVETGVAAGISTAFLGAALIENGCGTLYSIELPPKMATDRTHLDGASFDWPREGVGWAIPTAIRERMGGRHNLVLEDVRTALPRILDSLPGLDLFFHDDLHTSDHMLWQFRLVWSRLRAGGVLVADDVNEGWTQFCREASTGRNSLLNLQRLAVARKWV